MFKKRERSHQTFHFLTHLGFRHLKDSHSTLDKQRHSMPEHADPINLQARPGQKRSYPCFRTAMCQGWCWVVLGHHSTDSPNANNSRTIIIPLITKETQRHCLRPTTTEQWSWDVRLGLSEQKSSHIMRFSPDQPLTLGGYKVHSFIQMVWVVMTLLSQHPFHP